MQGENPSDNLYWGASLYLFTLNWPRQYQVQRSNGPLCPLTLHCAAEWTPSSQQPGLQQSWPGLVCWPCTADPESDPWLTVYNNKNKRTQLEQIRLDGRKSSLITGWQHFALINTRGENRHKTARTPRTLFVNLYSLIQKIWFGVWHLEVRGSTAFNSNVNATIMCGGGLLLYDIWGMKQSWMAQLVLMWWIPNRLNDLLPFDLM